MTRPRPQRIRDPLHNLIEFDGDQFEHTLWRVIQTRPFQRLRRIRQLAFSEFVFPGATHTRFAHSVGVFHIARILMKIIQRHISDNPGSYQYKAHQAQVALAAALVHDVGHGMFSHAFEDIGSTLNLKLANHEAVSDLLIRSSEISGIFSELGSGFANDVAEVIKRGRPGNLYDAVVSSQFDADRLDYMQRDRLMAGVQNGGIDFTWLIANLEIGTVDTGVDAQPLGKIDTFVLGPKAYQAAEAYVLALFQLYPTVYFHKASRGAEKVFSALMIRLIELWRGGHSDKVGLPISHPILRFAKDSDAVENVLALDDTVFWGALPMLCEASDGLIKELAIRLWYRRLPKSIDIREKLVAAIAPARTTSASERTEKKKRIDRLVETIEERLRAWQQENEPSAHRILIDRTARDPYKLFQESKGPLNQIRIRTGSGTILDVADLSPVIAAIESFELFRAYADETDEDARLVIDGIVDDEIRRNKDGNAQA